MSKQEGPGLDTRLIVKSCMFGCHSDLKKTDELCDFKTKETERACEGCTRRNDQPVENTQ